MKITISVFLTLAFAFSVHAQKQMQVTVTSTFLRKEPNATAEKVQTVQKGDRLNLERKQDVNNWYLVSTASGAVKGWIRKDTVEAAAVVVAEKPPRVVPAVSPSSSSPPPAKPISKNSPTVEKPISKKAPVVKPTPNEMPAATANPIVVPPVAQPIASPSASPTPDEEQEVIRVESEEVNLNVRVVDANNRAVKNLDVSQFKVYEDDVLQTVTAVSATEAPMINALVIDNSRSLRSQLKSIIEAGKIIVGTNRAADETAVIRFVGADKIETVRDFTANKNLIGEALDNLFVEGGQTAIIDAVYQAAQKIEGRQNSARKDDIRLRALVLVSDGDDRASAHGEQELFNLLRASQVQIYAVGFVNNLSTTADAASGANRQEKAKSFLTRLSEETGGRVYFPTSIEELPRIAAEISGELHAQYLISYTPNDEKVGSGGFRKLRVEINEGTNKEKRTAVTRAGRIAAGKQN